ncbi:hypothetical protein M407DRAFT_26896 [Tulasnella calospora MUT 4182]|uniref:Uncharacterized protein n=1 Tax=Tulasnella calospora MUT 4182 TaxID=1051891 RepID=A0A0C3QET1_9AGAM|nr:hypothetical protein M407DRAFT_26896 [Tulasnella calospora MUT 4182]
MVGILAARPVWAIQPCRRDPNNRQDLIKASIPRTLEYFCAVSPNLAERKSSQTTGSIVSPLHAFHSVSLPFSALFVAVFSVLLFPAPRVRVKVSKETSRTEIAIDLGSIYSSVSSVHEFRIISAEEPFDVSILSVDNGALEVLATTGDAHLRQAASIYETPPGIPRTPILKNTVFDAKRLIGLVVDVTHKNEKKQLTPEDISAMVLGKMKQAAEAYLGEKVTHTVVTVSTSFNDAQRRQPRTRYPRRSHHSPYHEFHIIVCDLGGGTIDVPLLSIDFEVLATAGDTYLGGEDFDNRIVDCMVKQYKKKTATDVFKDYRTLGKLECQVKKAMPHPEYPKGYESDVPNAHNPANSLTSKSILLKQPFAAFESALVLSDDEVASEGSLLEDFGPSVNPDKEIDDPEDRKPEDSVDEAQIHDTDAVKPVDWDED